MKTCIKVEENKVNLPNFDYLFSGGIISLLLVLFGIYLFNNFFIEDYHLTIIGAVAMVNTTLWGIAGAKDRRRNEKSK